LRVSVIVPVHNALEYVKKSLPAVIQELESPNTLVVVDDNSNVDTRVYLHEVIALARKKSIPSDVIGNVNQQLFTRTCNRGMRIAYHKFQPEIMVLVNTDCNLSPGWLAGIVDGFTDPKVGIVGYPDTPNGKAPYYRMETPPGYITGHCIGFRTSMLEKVGVLCETDTNGKEAPELAGYKGQAHIGSERILCWKANMHGWKTVYCHKNLVVHEAGKSWNHDLGWLANFNLEMLWEPCDTLDIPKFHDVKNMMSEDLLDVRPLQRMVDR
jgi:cellulose synthase/poly-beta-1,6-N-acetylglucosamine synthase-like glycosyltransferase